MCNKQSARKTHIRRTHSTTQKKRIHFVDYVKQPKMGTEFLGEVESLGFFFFFFSNGLGKFGCFYGKPNEGDEI